MIMLNAKTIHHRSVIDAINTMKQLYMLSTTAGIEKKYGTLSNP